MQNPNPYAKSKIQNPKSKIQHPKSKIQNPNGRVWGCHIKNGYYDNPKSKIQNPRSKIQNPRSRIQNPKSKIQKSKIQNPRSKIRKPKSKIQNPKSKIQNPRSKIQTPKSKIQTARLDFGFWSLDLGWPGWGGYVATLLYGWACKQKVGGSIPPVPGSNWAPVSPDCGFAGNRASVSSPVLWKLGANFQKNGGGLWCAKQLFYGFNFVNAGRKRK